MKKHFTVSIFIVHKDKVLLHLHKKAKIMLPLGGHIEANELPEETCMRESKEEAGLNINLYHPVNEKLRQTCELENERLLINPVYTMFGELSLGHGHIDFVFYATSESNKTNPADGESEILKWYTKDELKTDDNIQENTRTMAIEALELLTI